MGGACLRPMDCCSITRLSWFKKMRAKMRKRLLEKGSHGKMFQAAQKSIRHSSSEIGVTVARVEIHQRPACTNSKRKFGRMKSIVVEMGPESPNNLYGPLFREGAWAV